LRGGVAARMGCAQLVKVLILGASGMLGHRLAIDLSREFDVVGAIRAGARDDSALQPLHDCRLVSGLDAMRIDSAVAMIERECPDVVINCVGIVKQLKEAKDPIPSIVVNALFPHQLAETCRHGGIRLLTFSTDCVFSGRQGPYGDDATPDPDDLYGRTKLLGEVEGPGHLTLRTSIIGHELHRGTGLLEWFIAQRGKSARGFAGALYTGLTTNAMAMVVASLLRDFPELAGVWQVASTPIDKFTLLSMVNEIYRLGVTLERDTLFRCDRRLDAARFRRATGIEIPDWRTMLCAMADAFFAAADMRTAAASFATAGR
jgi:dTDP-4-dehydrorhamnose reductase